ncbi:MAG: choice-of-anchor Q domain-containing protein [Bacteroidota bacterium]
MKLKLILFFLPIALLLVWSCDRPTNPVEEGTLAFSSDTIKFDSIFTTFLTPSERLLVYNETGKAVQISRVWLQDGADTRFEMIVDGIQSKEVEDVVLANGDSLFIFVNIVSKLKDEFVEEFLNFQVGDEMQQVLIRAKIIDAYFLRSRIRQENDFLSLDSGSFVFTRDTILTSEKPIVMDGPIYVPPDITVTIEPGTEFFFTPYKFGVTDSNGLPQFAFFSWLIVDGTLIAEGMPGLPIIFQGSRFDSLYQENPAQWRGIRFGQNSKNNILTHCLIKNGLIGVQVDSSSYTANPKLRMQYTEIRNMGVHGVVGVGFAGDIFDNSPPMILMENCKVNTCRERTLAILGGGKYEFYNTTFANFSISRFSRRTPQVLISNWFTFDNVTANVYPSYIDFTNCLIWGSEEDEMVIDTLMDAPFDRLLLNHCMLALSEDNAPTITPHLRNSLVNQDPLFNDVFVRDYRLKEASPAINAGIDFPEGSSGYEDDFRNAPDTLRYDGFDIGAYEFYPIEE